MKVLLSIFLALFAVEVSAMEFTQTGNAMAPTIVHGEKVQVGALSALTYIPARWDVVLFKNPSGEFNALSGRIVGMPNEDIYLDDAGVHINGGLIELPQRLRDMGIKYIPSNKTVVGEGYVSRRFHANENEYFILGDNSYLANDGRFFGPIRRVSIINRIDGK